MNLLTSLRVGKAREGHLGKDRRFGFALAACQSGIAFQSEI
jgi:hypothetical protein